MTAAAIHDRADGGGHGAVRWGASFLAMLALHVGAGAGILLLKIAEPPSSPPPAAVMIDLAPMPAAPAAEPMDIAPGPPQEEAEPPPPEPPAPEPEPIPEPLPEPPPPEPPPPEPPVETPPEPLPEPVPTPAPEVAVAIPPPPAVKPKPPVRRPETPRVERPEPKREPDPRPAAKASTAPPAADLPPAPVAAAPAPGAPSMVPSAARATWQGRVLGHLERHKRYPRAAQMRRQQGVAYVRFTIDREGRVLSARLDRSSGHAALDEETVALLDRASPLPAPPADIARDPMELVVPVQFFIR